VFESDVGLPPEHPSLAAPNGCPKLIFLYGNSLTSIVNGRVQRSREGLYFVGNRDSATRLHSSGGRIGIIGIEFFPQGAYPCFEIPMSTTANRLFEADTQAEALQEAKRWLRSLTRKERAQQLDGLPRGTKVERRITPAAKQPRPYEHPHYWAAFILTGDPG
jgi:hypothetical protein